MKRWLLAVWLLVLPVLAQAAGAIEVWKDPGCGCCTGWVDHLRAAGFTVRAHDVSDVDAARQKNGVPRVLAACHTAKVEGYAIEGHVPAADIRRLLKERPQAAGLAVPGMPLGSPGMEAPNPQRYETLLVAADGSTRVWERHGPGAQPVALTAAEEKQYLAGAGMGYARAAEQNSYPGPMHVLELADQLQLSEEQRAATGKLMAAHKTEVREIGARVVEAERALEKLFRNGGADPEALAAAMKAATAAQGSYRLSHLETHRRMRALLTEEQVRRYNELRGHKKH